MAEPPDLPDAREGASQRPDLSQLDSLSSLASVPSSSPFPSSHSDVPPIYPVSGPSSVTMAPPAIGSPASTPSPRGVLPAPMVLPPERVRSPLTLINDVPPSVLPRLARPPSPALPSAARRQPPLQRSSSLSGPIAGPFRPPPDVGAGRVDPDVHWLSEDEGETQDRQGLSGPGGWRAPKTNRWEWEGEAYRKGSVAGAGNGSSKARRRPRSPDADGTVASTEAETETERAEEVSPARPRATPAAHLTGASVVAPLIPTAAFSRPGSADGEAVPPPLTSGMDPATVAATLPLSGDAAAASAAAEANSLLPSTGEPPPTARPVTPPQPLPPLESIISQLFDILKCTTPDRHSHPKSAHVRRAQSNTEKALAEGPPTSPRKADLGLALLEDPVTLNCGHTFCAECLGFSGQRRGGGRGQARTVARTTATVAPVAAPGTPTGSGGPLSGLMGIVRRASSGSPPAQHSPTSGGLFPSTTPTHSHSHSTPAPGPGSKVVCPVPTCESRQKGTGAVTDEMAVDVGLQKILMLIRREWPTLWDVKTASAGVSRGEVERDKAALEKEARQESEDSSTGDAPLDPEENAKRGHKTRSWGVSKRTKRGSVASGDLSQVVDAYPVVAEDPVAEKQALGFEALSVDSKTFDLAQLLGSPGQHPALVQDLLSELECQVCTMLFYEPVTTPCGHTFCKNCLLRSLDHSDKCPLCRADFPGFAFFQEHPINHAINRLLIEVFADLYAERKAASQEQVDSSLNTPLFICTLAFPSIPTFLHVFEPRYRLMMRRAMENDRRFGMVLASRTNGGPHEYGTMLEIRNMQLLQDGRSMVETMGVGRFRVLEHGTLDGYTVGRIQVIEDIPAEQEAELERQALARGGAGEGGLGPEVSTEELMRTCREFVEVLRSGSTPWILQRLNNTFGPMPSNPADFSYWMAMILPMAEEQKALLIPITSSRLRLRLIVHWIETFRSQWWFRVGFFKLGPLGPVLILLAIIVVWTAYQLQFVDWDRAVVQLANL